MSHPISKLNRFQKGVVKSKKRVSLFYNHMKKEERLYYVKKHACRYRNLTKKCSKFCCGNPRKFVGDLTIQEIRYGFGPVYLDGEM